jgi:hypothetical protein
VINSVSDLEMVVLPSPQLDDGGPDLPPIDGDGRRNQGCNTQYTLCGSLPTHHITYYRGDEGETEAETYCERHYAAELARFLMVHPVENHCDAPLSDHIKAYGLIAG